MGEQRQKGGLANSHPAKVKHLLPEGNPVSKNTWFHRGGRCCVISSVQVSLLQLQVKADGKMAITGMVLSKTPPLSMSSERQ